MKTLEIVGDNHFEKWTKHRIAGRGIVIDGKKVLLSYETLRDQYGIPGGGLEGDETVEACCLREIAEETGVVAAATAEPLAVNEYYEEYLYESHYFVCRAVGQTERKLTSRELQFGLTAKWIDIEEAVDIFSRHRDYADSDEEKRGIYLREYMALCEFNESLRGKI